MGYFAQGLPEYWGSIFRKLDSPRAFVETGTFEGLTSKGMISNFNLVHTIEASETYFRISQSNLAGLDVNLHFGESPQVLDTLIPTLQNHFVVFFLDAHYSSGETYGNYDKQPLLDELIIISMQRDFFNTLILIDDARLLNGWLGYPTISEISAVFNSKGIRTVIIDDIFVVGNSENIEMIGNPNDFSIQLTNDPYWYR
jgi:hypothetical protein